MSLSKELLHVAYVWTATSKGMKWRMIVLSDIH